MAEFRVFIDGGEGTTGLRIRQRLAEQPEIELLTLAEAQRKELPARLDAVQKADLTILCLPDAAAQEIAAAAGENARICDASTAHRTLLGWVYGFPELGGRRESIVKASRVAVPGCHASGFLALATPLVEQGALSPATPLACHSLTGYSGGGKKMIAAYEDPAKSQGYLAPRLYGLSMQHKHLPEMQAIAQLSAPPLFCPVVDDYYSGMLVSLPLPLAALAPAFQSKEAVAALLAAYYAGESLITVHPADAAPPDGFISAGEMAGRDSMEIFVLGSGTHLLLAARFDNLGKGASGAAVQCMNLMLGLPETAGLVL